MIDRSCWNDMYLRRYGSADARAIVYIHGLGESGLCFEGLITDPRLADWGHWVVDLPGYGKSPWPAEPAGLADHAALIARLIEGHDLAPAIVLGHSMGGVIGTMLCRQRPKLVRGFVNVEGNTSLDDCSFSSQATAFTPDEFAARGFDTMLEEIYAAGVVDRPLRTYYASLKMCDPRAYHLNSAELVENSRAGDLASRLGAIAAPVTYILGHPRGTGESSRRLLAAAGVNVNVIDHAGHWPFLDQPRAFAEEVARFLQPVGQGA